MSVSKIGAVVTAHSNLINVLAGLLSEIVNVVPLGQDAKNKVLTGIETLQVGAETLGALAEGLGDTTVTGAALPEPDTSGLATATEQASAATLAAQGAGNQASFTAQG